MRVAAGVVVAAFVALAPVPSHADQPALSGRTCAFASTGDPREVDGTRFADVEGGPVAVRGRAPLTLRCSVQVGLPTHADADAATLESDRRNGAAQIPPTSTAYTADPGDTVYVCTSVDVHGTTFYYDAPGTGGTGEWSEDSAGHCAVATSGETIAGDHDRYPGGVTVTGPCTTTLGREGCASYRVDGVVRRSLVAVTPGVAPVRVAGYVEQYRFDGPGGVTVTMPCVVLVEDTTTRNPCAGAGGTPSGRLLTLLDVTMPVPQAPFVVVPLVEVCDATVTLTADGQGFDAFPARALC